MKFDSMKEYQEWADAQEAAKKKAVVKTPTKPTKIVKD